MDHCRRLLSLTVLGSMLFFTAGAVTAAVGKDCILPCIGLSGLELNVLEWKRPDLNKDILLFREGLVLDGFEHSDYKHRVELRDPQLHSGDLSVVLKNFTVEDSGTYECHGVYKDKQEVSKIIFVVVTEQDDYAEHEAWIEDPNNHRVGPMAGAIGATVSLIIIICAGIVFLKREKINHQLLKKLCTSREPVPIM